MGLFGYGKGTYAKNTKRFKRMISDFMCKAGIRYAVVGKPLNEAIFRFEDSAKTYADVKALERADKRVECYLQRMESAFAVNDRATVIAYANFMPDAVAAREFGEHPEDAPILDQRLKVEIAKQRTYAALDALDEYKKTHRRESYDDDPGAMRLQADINERQAEHKALNELLMEMETQKNLKDLKETAEMVDYTSAFMDILDKNKK